MESMDVWWESSPFESRPELPSRAAEHVPVDLQFQRASHDANLGKQTSALMRLSPEFYQHFGSRDTSLKAHLAARLAGLWEYLVPTGYTPPARLGDVWRALAELAEANESGC